MPVRPTSFISQLMWERGLTCAREVVDNVEISLHHGGGVAAAKFAVTTKDVTCKKWYVSLHIWYVPRARRSAYTSLLSLCLFTAYVPPGE